MSFLRFVKQAYQDLFVIRHCHPEIQNGIKVEKNKSGYLAQNQ